MGYSRVESELDSESGVFKEALGLFAHTSTSSTIHTDKEPL